MESFSSGGRLWLIRAWVNGDIQWSEHLTKIIYSCTSCKNCVEKCPHTFSDDLVNMVVAAKTELIKIGKIPKPVKDFLENTQLYGNPYGISAKKRADWMEDLDIPAYNGHDYLYYVGCDGSFDPRAQKAARATARLLMSAGVSFGILGTDEISDGNEVDMLGEDGLLEYLAQKNIQKFSKLGVKNIITLSPHSYNVFKNKYPDFGGQYQVYHYTQILAGLIKNGKLKVPDTSGISITFHDPCFLGRWNKEYDAPRKIIQSFKGMTFNEMARNRKGALCCGGGAGNFYTDFLGGSDESPARIRIREAVDTRADVLAVACPNCLMMLEDAAASEGSEIIVKDISEIFFPE